MNTDLATIAKSPEAYLEELLSTDPNLRSRWSRDLYRWGVRAFDQWRGDRPISKSLLLEYLADLQTQGAAPNTINGRLAAVKWFVRRTADVAQDYANDPQLADEFSRRAARIASVHAVRVDHGIAGRHIEQGELQALLNVCRADERPAGRRDAAIFAVLWVTGMRRMELCHLQMSDLTKTDQGYTVQIVRGKGGKSRTAYVHGGAAAYLSDWLAIREGQDGQLFYSLDRRSHGRGTSLERSGLHFMFLRRCKEAGISERTTLHDMRRSFAGNLLQGGIDICTVQHLMGHASVATTGMYDRRGAQQQQEAVRVLHVPYSK